MKSLRVFAPCGILILCGLVDWSHSYPASGSKRVAESIARNLKDDDKYSGANAASADASIVRKVAPPTKVDTVDNGRVQDQYVELTGKTHNMPENGQAYKSLAGGREGGSPTVKKNQPQLAQGNNVHFIGKIKNFFTIWPVKFWEKVKHWFSKLNFFKSDEQKGINPSEDNFVKPNGQKGPNPPNDKDDLPSKPVVKPPKPGPGTGGANGPIPSEGSKVKSQAQTPPGSMRGSKLNPLETNNLKNPSRMSRQAPAQLYTNPQKGARATGAQTLPHKKSGPSNSITLPKYSKNLPLTTHQPYDTRMSMAQPNNQVASGPMVSGFGMGSGAAQKMLGEMMHKHQAMTEASAATFDQLARSNNGQATKKNWNSKFATLKITPNGKDGSATAEAELTSHHAEFEVDPKTGARSMRMNTSTMTSTTQHGPGSFLNLTGPGRGNNMAIPSHAFNNRDNFLKEAGKLEFGSKKPGQFSTPLLT